MIGARALWVAGAVLFAAAGIAACGESGPEAESGDFEPGFDSADTQFASAATPAPPAAQGQYQGQQAPPRQAAPRQAAPPQTSRAMPGDGLRVQRAEIIDAQGFEKPLVAATMMVPAGWQTQGGVVWNIQNQCGSGYNFHWSAAAPDGSTGLAIIPASSWAFANASFPFQSPCPNAQITSAQQYLQWQVQTARPNARILDYRPRPDLTKGLESMNRTDPMPLGEMRSWVDAGEMLIGYNANGREMRESVAAVVVVFSSKMQNAMGGVDEFFNGTGLPGYAFYAPEGQLNFKMAEALRQTFRQGAEWSARIAEHQRKIAQTNLKGAQDRSRIISQTNREISDIQMESWKNQQASGDRMQRERTEMIRGVETYNDPESSLGSVELSSLYDNAWRMPDGTYVLTDDAFFNPADGVKLEPLP